MRISFVTGLIAITVMVSTGGANAFVLLSEDFDSMGSTGTAPPANWKVGPLGTAPGVNHNPGTGNTLPVRMPQELLQVDNGTKTGDSNGVSYNYGTTGAADRALGNIPRTGQGGDRVTQVAILNNTGYTLDSFTLGYVGEQWHRGESKAAAQPEKLRVYYSFTETSGYVRMDPLDFIAPQNVSGAAQAALDGNDPANRVALSTTVGALAIDPGSTLYVRWYDYNDDATLDHGLAIDDVLVTATPEPATMILLALGGLALLRRRTDAGRSLVPSNTPVRRLAQEPRHLN